MSHGSNGRNTVSRMVELMKSVRTEPLAMEDMAEHIEADVSLSTIWNDTRQLEELGVLVRVEVKSDRGGAPLVGFKLSRYWGGQVADDVTRIFRKRQHGKVTTR
jgi:DNA-binding Lrp family transcriptional regulator